MREIMMLGFFLLILNLSLISTAVAVEVRLGTSVDLSCDKDAPPNQYRWQKFDYQTNNFVFLSDDYVKYSGLFSKVLQIIRVAYNDEGYYRCVVNYPNEQYGSGNQVIVLDPVIVKSGESTSMSCPLVAAYYQWEKQTVNTYVALLNSNKYNGVNAITLIIRPTETYDGGIYRCRVFHSDGSQSGEGRPIMLLIQVDGSWSPWSEWNDCTKTCGGGYKLRNRTCSNPTPTNGGADCGTSNTKTMSCSTNSCPVDGSWSPWSVWSDCTKTCGGGYKTRSRICSNPSPANGGADCGTSNTETMSCSTNSCPEQKPDTGGNKTKAGPIVGGVVAVIVTIFVLTFLFFRWRRNINKRQTTDYEIQDWKAYEDHVYTEQKTDHLYSNTITDNALKASSEQLEEKSNEENNIILRKIDASLLTAFLQDKHSKKEVLRREFQWLQLYKTSRTETVNKSDTTDDKAAEIFIYYNSIDRSLESNRNTYILDKEHSSIIQEVPGQENVESFWQMVEDFHVENIILIVQKKEKIPDFYPVTDESLELQTMNIELCGSEKSANVFIYSFNIHNKVKRSYRCIKLSKTSDWKENQKYPSVELLCSLLFNVDKRNSTPLVIVGNKPYGFPTCGVVSVCLEVMKAMEKDQMFSFLELALFVSEERDLFTYFEEYELCYNLIQHYLETAHTYDLIE